MMPAQAASEKGARALSADPRQKELE